MLRARNFVYDGTPDRSVTDDYFQRNTYASHGECQIAQDSCSNLAIRKIVSKYIVSVSF